MEEVEEIVAGLSHGAGIRARDDVQVRLVLTVPERDDLVGAQALETGGEPGVFVLEPVPEHSEEGRAWSTGALG